MAKIPMNAITRHLQGRVGDIVFRNVGEDRVAALRPKRTLRPPTPAMLLQRGRFRSASTWAKSALQDPAVSELYASIGRPKRMSAYATAVTDWFKPPVVEDIDLRGYTGAAGGEIKITARDDTEVTSLAVEIRDVATNTVLESGGAELVQGYWIYQPAVSLLPSQAVMIKVTAVDRPGNQGFTTKAYP
jgi:hypothetical protein